MAGYSAGAHVDDSALARAAAAHEMINGEEMIDDSGAAGASASGKHAKHKPKDKDKDKKHAGSHASAKANELVD